MESIRIAFEVVFPLFAMMAVGFIVRRVGLLDEQSTAKVNALVFRVFLPVLVFMNICTSDVTGLFTPDMLRLVAICLAGSLLFIFLPMLLLARMFPDIKRRSVVTQGIFRGNMVLFGIPVATTIGGAEAALFASVLIATIVPFYNMASVVLLERARSSGASLKKLLLGIVKNPLIIASALGILVGVLHIELPDALASPLESFANVGTPLAFLVLGASLRFENLAGDLKPILTVVVGKLILVPAVVFLAALLLGCSRLGLVALVGAMASPTAVSSFSMAKEMDVEGELAGRIVVFTSVASILTLFCWVAGLTAAGLL